MPMGTNTSAQKEDASSARATSRAISPTYRGLRLSRNGPDWSMRIVAPPGRIAVRLDAITDNVHPFHSTKATTKVVPIHRVAELAIDNGSPTATVSTSPAPSGTPKATGGQIRYGGAFTVPPCLDLQPTTKDWGSNASMPSRRFLRVRRYPRHERAPNGQRHDRVLARIAPSAYIRVNGEAPSACFSRGALGHAGELGHLGGSHGGEAG